MEEFADLVELALDVTKIVLTVLLALTFGLCVTALTFGEGVFFNLGGLVGGGLVLFSGRIGGTLDPSGMFNGIRDSNTNVQLVAKLVRH